MTRRAAIELGLLACILALLTLIVVVAADGASRRTLRVDVLSARRAEPGELLTITISTRDNSGIPARVDVDMGDGHREVIEPDLRPCSDSEPRSESFDLEHSFPTPGVYTVRATVTSEGCGPRERKTAIRTIVVKPLPR